MRETSIRKKLIKRGGFVLLLTIILLVTSLIVINILSRTSNEFQHEYIEMNSLQELKLSLFQLLLLTDKTTISHSENDREFFMIMVNEARKKLKNCRQIMRQTNNNKKILGRISRILNETEKNEEILFQTEINMPEYRQTHKQTVNEIESGLSQLDELLIETHLEVSGISKINQTVFKHSTLTLLGMGILIVLTFLIGGLRFINRLTKPIHSFVTAANKISKGERNIKVSIQTTDEFSTLANAFNNMSDNLKRTTVSKSYLDNILKNMFNSLIITDASFVIRDVNKATVKLLGYQKTQLVGQPVQKIFGDNLKIAETNDRTEALNAWEKVLNKTSYFINRSGQTIASLISCTILKNNQGESEGLIIVGHDLRSKLKIEKKLEWIRKQRQIDINEAQEEERMRIATDIHDGLGQLLTAISYTAQEFYQLETANPSLRQKLIRKIDEQISGAIKESKNLSLNLIPIVLKDFGMVAAINNLVERANEMYDTHFTFNAYDFNERIDVKLEKVLYRICQESMNNIVKHAKARNANYQIFKQTEIIVLVIDDDGIGFDINLLEKNGHKGIGLISMKERVLAFDGTFSIDSQPGLGTEIIIEIPCQGKNSYDYERNQNTHSG